MYDIYLAYCKATAYSEMPTPIGPFTVDDPISLFIYELNKFFGFV